MKYTARFLFLQFLWSAFCLCMPAKTMAQQTATPPQHFHVQTPGSLPTLIGEAQKNLLTDIAVEGALNGTDLRFLREMAGSDAQQQPTEGQLAHLDLSRATFTPGGEAYIYKDEWQTVKGGALVLPDFAFRHCRLATIVLPERMDTIGIGAFELSALRSIRLPEESVVLGWAFNQCKQLTQVEFPQHLIELGQDCFRNCDSLRTLRFHDVQFLPYHAFQDATGLEEIIIDGALWHADGWICDACPNLRRIEFSGVILTTGGPTIASNCPMLSEILFSGFSFPIHFSRVENCPKMQACRVTGSILQSACPDFLPPIRSASDVSRPLLQRATAVVAAMSSQKKLSRWNTMTVRKNEIIRQLAAVQARCGRKAEALQTLALLCDIGFPFTSRITSDSAFASLKNDADFIELMKKIETNADYLRMIRLSLPYETGSAFRQAAPLPPLSYAPASDSTLQRIRSYFQADYIAGSGSEVERIKNVMFWVHDRIRHRGNFLPSSQRTAIDLVEGCWKAGRDGMNARGQAIVLAELYQALGWPARFITCQSKFYADDPDATVVTVVWSFTLGKWVMMDASYAAYVTDEDGLLLHPGEIRQHLKDGRPLLLNKEANCNYQQPTSKEYYLDYYMAKNLYYMSGFEHNAPNIDCDRHAAYYTLSPVGSNVKIGIPVYDDAWFWQKPL